jgi:Divergent InlB B-repeat domain
MTVGMRHGRHFLLVLLVAGLAAPVTADAAARPTTPELLAAAERRGEISSDRANLYLAYAFGDAGSLPSAYRSSAPWDGTLPLLRLRREVRAMPPGRVRKRIEGEITAQHAGSFCGDSSATTDSFDSTFFHIDHSTIGGGLDINAYAASLDQSWSTQVVDFGWAAPPVHPTDPPPGGLYHVHVDTLAPGLYGYVATDGTHGDFVGNNPNTSWSDGDALASCMVLDDDYSAFGNAQAALDATTAHEFNHAIQYGYGAATGPNVPDEVFFEGGATWMEDEVFDASNDNYNFLWPAFGDSLGDYDSSPYEYWLTFRGLTERFGTGVAGAGEDVMQRFWEATSQGMGNMSAMGSALSAEGITLAQAFHDYAIAVKYNRACAGGYVLPWCFEEGPAYVNAVGSATPVTASIGAVGGATGASIEDNYAINWVALPVSAPGYRVTLQNTSAGGTLRGTVVCDSGAALLRTPLPALVGSAGSQRVEGFSTAGCGTPVLAITNQAQMAQNPAASALRSYTVTTADSASTKPLAVARAGAGSGTVSGSGIACGFDCAQDYANGTPVTLTATPAAGSTFGGWSGACAGTGACTVTMDAARSVTATFSPGGGAGGDAGPPPDRVAPALTRLRLSSRRFRAARAGASISAPVGARVSFRLNERGRVRFRVERKATGRRAGGRCRAATRRLRNRPRCTRWVRVRGGFSVRARSGRKSFRFRGRVGGRRLRVGGHRLVARASDAAGNVSRARRLSFRIVRR